jgi:hypothetical protein
MLLLLLPELASASNSFLSENSRLEKNLGHREIHQASPRLNAETHRVCDDSCQKHAADCVVAPKTALAGEEAAASNSARKMAVQEALEKGEINATTAQRAGVAKPPQHHIFPQAERQWFADRGVDIDKFTVKLDQGTHEALHYGGGPGKGGGWWNEQIMKTLTEREAALGRKLTPQEIEAVGKEMMSRAKISDLPIVPYKEAP